MTEITSVAAAAGRIDHRRRAALGGLGAFAAAVAAGFSTRVIAKTSLSMARAGAWFLGGRLSIATNVYFRTSNADYTKYLDQSKNIARDLGFDIAALPPRPAVSSDGLLKYLEYCNKGDGARIRADLARNWGVEHATLYQIAVRLIQLSLMYDLDPKLGDRIAKGIADDCERVGLPGNLWRPPIDAVAKREKADDVKKKAIQTYFDVQEFLLKSARG